MTERVFVRTPDGEERELGPCLEANTDPVKPEDIFEPPGTCAGGCCERFTLPFSREVLKRKAQEGMALNGTVEETRTVAEMVVPLEGGRQTGYFQVGKKVIRLFDYTCRYWDHMTKKCTIYHRRPVVCRQHPAAGDRGNGCGGCWLDKTGTCTLKHGTDPDVARKAFLEGRP